MLATVAQWLSIVVMGLLVRAQVVSGRASDVKQLPNLSCEFTRCGNTCSWKKAARIIMDNQITNPGGVHLCDLLFR